MSSPSSPFKATHALDQAVPVALPALSISEAKVSVTFVAIAPDRTQDPVGAQPKDEPSIDAFRSPQDARSLTQRARERPRPVPKPWWEVT